MILTGSLQIPTGSLFYSILYGKINLFFYNSLFRYFLTVKTKRKRDNILEGKLEIEFNLLHNRMVPICIRLNRY